MKLRAAVVGVGYLGQFHAQKFKTLCDTTFLNKIEFVGVCDQNPEQAEKVGKQLGVPFYTHPQELIGKVDLVTISTITSTHYALAKMFLEKGVHVNVEKPITVLLEEAEELISVAQKKGLILSVGHSERFNPAYKFIQSRLKHDSSVKWAEFHRYAPFKLRGSDVSVVHDLMIHDFDLALSLISQKGEPEFVSVVGGSFITKQVDWARVLLKFPSGLKMQISTSRMAPEMTRRVLVHSGSIYEGNLQTGDVHIVSRELKDQSIVSENYSAGKGDNLLVETEIFFRSVLGDESPVIHGEDGLRALKLVHQTLEKIGLHR